MLFEAGPSVSINEMSNMGDWFVANVIILQNLAGEDQAAAAADRDYRRQVGVAPESGTSAGSRSAKPASCRRCRPWPAAAALEGMAHQRPTLPFADFMWGMMLLVSFPLMVFYGFLLIGAGTRQESDQISIFCFLTTVVAGYSCVEIGAPSLACSVVKERQRQTLDGLLTLPVSAVEILQERNGWEARRRLGLIVYMAMILALRAGGWSDPLVRGPAAHVCWAAHVSFVASLGLFVSVVFCHVLIAQVRDGAGFVFAADRGLRHV